MSSKQQFPAWHPGEQLHADNLVALEGYLLSRFTITEGALHGIDRFNWQTSLKLAWTPEGLRCNVLGVSGVTPSGEPVYVVESDQVAGLIERTTQQSEAQQLAMSDMLWDVGIEVNRRFVEKEATETGTEVSGEALESGMRPKKFEVLGKVAKKGQPAFRHKHWLYLGRYAVSANGHRLVEAPMVWRLGSLEPRDETWREWVSPLSNRIQSLVSQLLASGTTGTALHQALASEVVKLAYEWPSLPISGLAHRMRFLAWLNARTSGTVPVDDFSSSLPIPFPPSNVDGVGLPRALAELLPGGLNTVAEASAGVPAGELTIGRDLLVALSEEDVDYYAPIGLLARLSIELERVATADAQSAQSGLTALRAPKPTSAAESPWHRMVRLLCAARIEQAAGNSVPAELVSGVLGQPGGPLAVAAADEFHQLLGGIAEEKRAGPMAAFWIARALAICPTVKASLSPMAQTYLLRALGDLGHFGPKDHHSAPRSYGYVKLQKEPPKASMSGAPFLKAPKSHGVASKLKSSAAARIVIVGPARSGKGGIAATLQELRIRDSLELDVREISVAKDAGLTSADKEQLASANLIIVALHPEYVAKLPAGIEAEANWMLDSVRAHVNAIAIAFTRADEYGVLTGSTQRMLSRAQVDLVARLPNHDAWGQILNQPGSTTTLDGSAVFSKPGDINFVKEFGPTRRWVLERTRALWDAASRAVSEKRFLNGYFVAGNAVDPRFKALDQRGLGLLLDDHFASRKD